MGLEQAFQIEFAAIIIQEAIIAFEVVALAARRLGIGALRLGGLVADHLDEPLSQSLITELTIPKLLLRPTRTIQTTLHAQSHHRGWLHSHSTLEMMDQRINVDVLDALGGLMAPVAPTPFGLAHLDPIGRFVTGTLVSLGLHKTLQQPRAQAVTALEIRAHAPCAQPQDMRGQIGAMHSRTNEESIHIEDSLQILAALAVVPSNPIISAF